MKAEEEVGSGSGEKVVLRPFFVTYGGGTRQADGYSVVFAESYGEARGIIHQAIGEKFAFCYDEKGFEGQASKYGLTQIPLQPQQRMH